MTIIPVRRIYFRCGKSSLFLNTDRRVRYPRPRVDIDICKQRNGTDLGLRTAISVLMADVPAIIGNDPAFCGFHTNLKICTASKRCCTSCSATRKSQKYNLLKVLQPILFRWLELWKGIIIRLYLHWLTVVIVLAIPTKNRGFDWRGRDDAAVSSPRR